MEDEIRAIAFFSNGNKIKTLKLIFFIWIVAILKSIAMKIIDNDFYVCL